MYSTIFRDTNSSKEQCIQMAIELAKQFEMFQANTSQIAPGLADEIQSDITALLNKLKGKIDSYDYDGSGEDLGPVKESK